MASGSSLLSATTQRRSCSTSTRSQCTSSNASLSLHAALVAAPSAGRVGAQCSVGLHAHPGCSASRRSVRARAVDPAQLTDTLGLLAAHLPMAYEPVALPCSMMKCGDVLHRSTLDLALRGEITGPDWRTFALLATVGTYLFMPPGVLPGAWDYYVLAKMRSRDRAYSKEDITMGRKLATGGFGTVFLGEMKMGDGTVEQVIVKKAKEFGQAEAWMNERLMRLGGGHAAEFITAFDESLDLTPEEQAMRNKKKQRSGSPLYDDSVWLVWKYEGDNTLFNLMESKEFPYNLEPLLLDRELRLPKGAERKAVTIRLALKQLLQALAAAHSSGIVHRDVKPQNCIISDRDKKIKLIDLGAAADLRIGINYAPNEYLLDPRYAPPQQYVMSTQTPRPPPAPVAAFLSPVLWRMENPDRFDMYSCGVTLLQMVFPHLRNDNNLLALNKKLETLKWDLRAWRREEFARKGGLKPDVAEGFAVLDLDDGAGWKLLCDLMAYKPTDRCSASEALDSPFFTGCGTPSATEPMVAASRTAITSAARVINKTLDSQAIAGFVNSATGQDRGSLTEAQLAQELGLSEAAPIAPRRASNTIAWWNQRQSEMRKSIERRPKGEGSQGTSGVPMRGSSSSRKSASPTASGSFGKGAFPAALQSRDGSAKASSASPSPSPTGSWWDSFTTGSAPKSNIAQGFSGTASPSPQPKRNGKDKSAGMAAAKRAQRDVQLGPRVPIALLSWGGNDDSEDEAQSASGSDDGSRSTGAAGSEARDVELVGQRPAAPRGLGFLSNVLGGNKALRGNGSNV